MNRCRGDQRPRYRVDRPTFTSAISTAGFRRRGQTVNGFERKGEKVITKLLVQAEGAQIKIEVTPVLRGCVYEPVVRSVSARVEDQFGFACNAIARNQAQRHPQTLKPLLLTR